MKIVLHFIASCFISFFAFMGALNMKNPFPCFGIVALTWVLFIWSYTRRAKREAERRSREHLFEDYMRSKLGNDRRHRN